MKKSLWQHLASVRQTSPLVHNITNFVVMNNTANALLAIGASPVMAHAHAEVKDLVAIANALVVNIGTLDEYWSEAMLLAAATANQMQKTWILDPVGAGASPYRDQVLQQLLQFQPTVIRGNASEIISLAKASTVVTKGVDSTVESSEAIIAAKSLAHQFSCTVCISGAKDYILDQHQLVSISNGHPLMTKVTGLGCSATAIIGAFAGIIENKLEATVAAMALIGIAGELAASISKGPGSLQANLLDQLYSMDENTFYTYLKMDFE